MSDDYNTKVASSELAKLGIVEKEKELDRVVPNLIQENELCNICEGKGYINLSATDNENSRVDCDECQASGLPLSQDERDYIKHQYEFENKEFDLNYNTDSLFDDSLFDDVLPVKDHKTKKVTTGAHNQWSKDSVAEKLEEIKDNYEVQGGECTIEPEDMTKIVDLLKNNFGDLIEHAGFVYKNSQATKIIGDLIEDFLIKETTHDNNKIIVDSNE